jgi:hypothetical protein
MPADLFTIEFYEGDGRSPVEVWMEKDLTDIEFAALLSAPEHVLEPSRHRRLRHRVGQGTG